MAKLKKEKSDPCWDNYAQRGMKNKNGKKVPNCVPKESGVNPRLLAVVRELNSYCRSNNAEYDIACDESDLQGVKIFQRNRKFLNGLLGHLEPFLEANQVHLETQKVRGGSILAFSLEAISEQEIVKMVHRIGEEIEKMTFEERIEEAFRKKPMAKPAPKKQAKPPMDFEKDAQSIANTGCIDCTDEQPQNSKATTKPSIGSSKGMPLRFENKIANVFGSGIPRERRKFNKQLREALNGMATSATQSPDELFQKFAKSLQVLGKQMGIGPLQDKLQEQGIKWKKSDDGMSIILYVLNAQTNAPQPITRISAETLDKPNEFENSLKQMLDFAKGDAPGAFQQEQEAMRDLEKTIRDISKTISTDDDEIQMQMQMGDQEMEPEQPVDLAAAQKAASLK
jgi:hypothetical protein